MKDPVRLKELIVENLSLAEVMLDYGVQFAYDPRNASEVQFKCPFHGKDNKPSARLYSATKSCFCWVCRKSWNVVSFVMDKENLRFGEAVGYIIDRWKIDTSSIPDAPILEAETPAKISDEGVLLGKIRTNLLDLKGEIPLEKYGVLCSLYLNLSYRRSVGETVLDDLKKVEGKIACLTRE